MVKLTEDRILLICQQEDKGRVSHTPQTLARLWKMSDRRICQIAQKYREVPLLNPKRRPPGPPLSPEQEAAVQLVWERDQKGATNVYLRLQKEGITIPKHKICAMPQYSRRRDSCVE